MVKKTCDSYHLNRTRLGGVSYLAISLLCACQAAAPILPTSTPITHPVEITASYPAPTLETTLPPTPTAENTIPPFQPLVDSGQRLGLGRSWDVDLGDLDNDGDLDAVVANDMRGEIPSAAWINTGQGIFTNSGQNLGFGMGLELADLDGDQDMDIFFVSWDEPASVWFNDGNGIFTDSGQALGTKGGWDVALSDLDNDGDADAIIAHEKADTVWMNDGSGLFRDSGQALGTTYSAAVGLDDMDGDGDADAITVGWGEAACLWLNDGKGIFSDSGQTLTIGGIHIHGMVLGDLNGDAAADVVMTGGTNQVWLNHGLGAFVDSRQSLSNLPGDTAALGDLEGDGDLDIYLAIGTRGNSQDKLYLNDGTGLFTDSGSLLSTEFTSGAAFGDLDGDGDPDVFVTHGDLGLPEQGGLPNEVWLNQTLP